jgi:putative Mn2+ efflux pump MntP
MFDWDETFDAFFASLVFFYAPDSFCRRNSMTIWEIIAVGLGLSMDAACVALCSAMANRQPPKAFRLALPLSFGVFQGLMPDLGFFLGSLFSGFVSRYAGIVTLIILAFIGGNMIKGAFEFKCDVNAARLTVRSLLLQSLATSIDAFAVGVSFFAMGVNLVLASPVIAATTFCCSLFAMLLGRRLGDRFGKNAEIAGGVVLILIGIKAILGL